MPLHVCDSISGPTTLLFGCYQPAPSLRAELGLAVGNVVAAIDEIAGSGGVRPALSVWGGALLVCFGADLQWRSLPAGLDGRVQVGQDPAGFGPDLLGAEMDDDDPVRAHPAAPRHRVLPVLG